NLRGVRFWLLGHRTRYDRHLRLTPISIKRSGSPVEPSTPGGSYRADALERRRALRAGLCTRHLGTHGTRRGSTEAARQDVLLSSAAAQRSHRRAERRRIKSRTLAV